MLITDYTLITLINVHNNIIIFMHKSIIPTVLIIRDGWGENYNINHNSFNATYLANTPVDNYLKKKWPTTSINTSGLAVGLPEGIMGNSEVGHQNIGAGRIVNQEIIRISKALSCRQIYKNQSLKKMCNFAYEHSGRIHMLGLVSNAGIHSLLEHLYSLLSIIKNIGKFDVYIHFISDGRDTSPLSGLAFAKELEFKCKSMNIGSIASVIGRYWAMDRDLRWNRVKKAYDCLVGNTIEHTAYSASEAIESYYNQASNSNMAGDEFITPTTIINSKNIPLPRISHGDAVCFFNFRGDRPRELTYAFIQENFKNFNRKEFLNIHFVTMTEYKKNLCKEVIFHKPPKMNDTLGQYISQKGLMQLRCAETEKYPYVTFFFNDYREEPFKGEDRLLIDSPRSVETYDQKPEMSAITIAKQVSKAIISKKYSLIVVNLANCDMVGHTGSIKATKIATEIVDYSVGKILNSVDKIGGRALITADHGNADQMWDPITSSKHTMHTLNPVSLSLYGKGCKNFLIPKNGCLADVGPTVLNLMNLSCPNAMTGNSLIKKM